MRWLTLFDDGGTGAPPGWETIEGSPVWTRGSAADTPGDGPDHLIGSSASGSSLRKMHWTDTDTAVDQEVVGAVLATGTSSSNEFGGISVRSAGPGTYYHASLGRLDGVSEIIVGREIGGDWDSLGIIPLTWSVSQWVCLRLRVIGSQVRVRAWIPSDPTDPGANEPTGWQFDEQDTTVTAEGSVAVNYWHSSGGRWAFLGYATDGDTAPILPSDLDPPEPPAGLTVTAEGSGLRTSWTSDGDEFVVERERWTAGGDPP